MVRGKSADMQPIPKGEPVTKAQEAKAKADKKKADKVAAKIIKSPEPQQYVAQLVGDVVKVLRENGGRVWKDLKEKEQQAIIGLIQNAAESRIKQIVSDMAGQGHPAIGLTLAGVDFKKDKTVKFAVSALQATKACHIASERIGTKAVLVLVDPSVYMGGDMPEADKDQPDLNLPQPESAAYEEFPDSEQEESDDEYGDDE